MDHDKLPIREYAKLPPRFNPTRFDADAWVKLAKAAGAKYITITGKHHDGFCMFASRLTDYDIVDATPYHADPLKALADACHQQKIKLFFYYSLLDWHHPDYFPLGKTGQTAGRETKGDWKRYVAYYQGQVRELCTNYGEIGGIWFDGWWDKPDADWDLAGTYRLIHELQPGALVGNNHHVAPLPGEDFQMFEQDLPGDNAAGFNKAGVSAGLPLETCLTINRSWGYNCPRHGVQEPEADHPRPGRVRGTRGQPALERRAAARRHDRSGSQPAAARSREMAGDLRRIGLRHAPRADPAQPWGVSTAKGDRSRPEDLLAHPQAQDGRADRLRSQHLVDAVPLRQDDATQTGSETRRTRARPARGCARAHRHDRCASSGVKPRGR